MSSCNEKHHENHPHLTSTEKAAVIRQSDTVIMLIICTMAIFTIRMAVIR